jgi:hypothetical protein
MILMSLATITLWTASQEVFVFVCFTSTPQLLMADLKEQCIGMKFHFRLGGETASEIQKSKLGFILISHIC